MAAAHGFDLKAFPWSVWADAHDLDLEVEVEIEFKIFSGSWPAANLLPAKSPANDYPSINIIAIPKGQNVYSSLGIPR